MQITPNIYHCVRDPTILKENYINLEHILAVIRYQISCLLAYWHTTKNVKGKEEDSLLETKAPSSSLSYTIAALYPAFWAFLTLWSNVQFPLIKRTNGRTGPWPPRASFVNSWHASRGSAIWIEPHMPDPFTAGAVKFYKNNYYNINKSKEDKIETNSKAQTRNITHPNSIPY